MQLLKLFFVHFGRRLHHQAGGILDLRERDDVADAVGAHHQHDDAVEAVSQPGMGRHAVLERIKKEAELFLGTFLCEAENLKHLLLHVCLVDPDGTAAKLGAV